MHLDQTVDELLEALIICHESQDIGVVLISGEGPSTKDGGWAFCSEAINEFVQREVTKVSME